MTSWPRRSDIANNCPGQFRELRSGVEGLGRGGTHRPSTSWACLAQLGAAVGAVKRQATERLRSATTTAARLVLSSVWCTCYGKAYGVALRSGCVRPARRQSMQWTLQSWQDVDHIAAAGSDGVQAVAEDAGEVEVARITRDGGAA
jgi:hypothetical protein